MKNQHPHIALRIFRDDELIFSTPVDKPIEVGRQRATEGTSLTRVPGVSCDRVVVAALSESRVSRSQLLIEPTGAMTVRLTNTSQTRVITMENGIELRPGMQCVAGDICMKVDNVQLHISVPQWNVDEYSQLEASPLAEREVSDDRSDELSSPLVMTAEGGFTAEQEDVVEQWLRSIVGLAIGSEGSSATPLNAVAIVAKITGFQHVSVHRRVAESWQMERESGKAIGSDRGWHQSPVGHRMLDQERTVARNPDLQDASQAKVAEIACPIFDSVGQVVGCLYAQRYAGQTPAISRFEASVCELVANCISNHWQQHSPDSGSVAGRVLRSIGRILPSGFRSDKP